MFRLRRERSRGFTVVEVVIATAIALVITGVILQTMILTARTTEQTSIQADMQSHARIALAEWEEQLRDGYAILTTYTPQVGSAAGTVFTTGVTDESQTIIAAVPSIDGTGVPYTWKGENIAFDCIIWRAELEGEGDGARWSFSRMVFPDAFRMPESFSDSGTSSSTSSGAPANTELTMGRMPETDPKVLFENANAVQVSFLDDAGAEMILDPISGLPSVGTSKVLPLWRDAEGNTTSVPISITDAASVRILLRYEQDAGSMQTGHADVRQWDEQSISIRLRNKPSW
jgi:Tfp pilus assembly protein PilE